MNIKFIGTGSGKSSLKRFHSSILVSTQNSNLLIDCGDSTSRALLKAEIDFNSINGIIFSHLHPDHFSGLGELLIQMKMGKRKAQLDISSGKDQVNFIKEYILNSYLLHERMNFEIKFYSIENDSTIQIDSELKILPRSNNHLAELKSYPQYKNLSFDSFSFLISDGKKNLVYTGDVGVPKDLYLFQGNKIDLFISEATHVSPDEIIIAHKTLNPLKAILTHIPDENERMILNQIKNFDPKGNKIGLAYDGLEIQL